MAAPTVYNDVAGGLDIGGQLFAGKKFFVVQRVPSRHRLLDDIKANGGEIVMLEKKADYVIADHLLPKFCPPGSISYEFVDKSISDGHLRDPEDHVAGPPVGEAREPGAINRPTKFGRTAYTAEEDRILYKWVRDCEASGGLSSGNEIYKRLEAKHPSHTWQSWRDRYVKRLKNQPPSAFNIPDNAPPSPPSDQSNQPAPSGASSTRPAKQPSQDPESLEPKRRSSVNGKARAKDDYNLDELATMFATEDWEELYAFVDLIESMPPEGRPEAWTAWAEHQANQTSDQWQQYYDKVVRPQWMRDPEWKRQQIREKIEKRHEETASQQQQESSETDEKILVVPEQPAPAVESVTATANMAAPRSQRGVQKPAETEAGKFEQLLVTKQDHSTASAYVYYAREKQQSVWTAQPSLDYAGLHKVLIRQWHLLSDEDKAPYVTMDQAAKADRERKIAELTKPPSEPKLMSSSTARHESPAFFRNTYGPAMKRARSHGAAEDRDNEAESIRPTKRRKSDGATRQADGVPQDAAITGTQEQPLEISSQTSDTSESRGTEDRIEQQIMSDMAQTERISPGFDDEDQDDLDHATESIESDEPANLDGQTLLPDDILPNDTEEDSPINSPTPRAPRHKKSLFDTQAILSSPSQDLYALTPQPQPAIRKLKLEAESDPVSSSPLLNPVSDASTPPSIQEYRRSLNSQRQSPSPTPSTASSAGSEDPDPPLTAAEFNLFFQEQYEEGFGDDFIAAALKRTRMRPALAITVLEAWAQRKPLPDQRGIWSKEDDGDVEGGDGFALERLAKKHSIDGWGGITERLKFLESYRSR
ncbi:hypothetical protein NX059_011390 [Plenodomus lindquistii]|nr:hypothetical protein NX059_011390 [Plenodomus lindquistii]